MVSFDAGEGQINRAATFVASRNGAIPLLSSDIGFVRRDPAKIRISHYRRKLHVTEREKETILKLKVYEVGTLRFGPLVQSFRARTGFVCKGQGVEYWIFGGAAVITIVTEQIGTFFTQICPASEEPTGPSVSELILSRSKSRWIMHTKLKRN